MQLNNLNEEDIKVILIGLTDNKLKSWIKLQLEEQVKGGGLKARIRERGYVI
jgi:hypothetical protein